MKSGPIIVIEDDEDDKDIFEEILKDLAVKNKLTWFRAGKDCFAYLKSTTEQPFIIFCDVNLPLQTGIEFKRQIDADPQLRKKSIPFVFYSTSVNQHIVNEAYTEMTVQGFFQKKSNSAEIKSNIRLILDYWNECRHPNTR